MYREGSGSTDEHAWTNQLTPALCGGSLSSDDSALHIPKVSPCVSKECSRFQKTKLAAYTEASDNLSDFDKIGSISGSRGLCKYEECRLMLCSNGLHDLESVGGQRTFTVVILHGETELGIFDMKTNPWSWIPVNGSHEQDLSP